MGTKRGAEVDRAAEFWFGATAVRVVDADTIEVSVDLGLRVSKVETLRVLGVDAPEKGDPDPRVRKHALRAMRFASEFLGVPAGPRGRPLVGVAPTARPARLMLRTLKPHPDDPRGRWLACVYLWPGAGEPDRGSLDGWLRLDEELLARGLARVYDGRAARKAWRPDDCPPIDAP